LGIPGKPGKRTLSGKGIWATVPETLSEGVIVFSNEGSKRRKLPRDYESTWPKTPELKKKGGKEVDMRGRLLELIREKSYEQGEVTLTSGKKSQFYIDGKQTTLDPEGGYLVGRLFYEMIKKSSTPVEAVGGPTLGADPIVTAISVLSYMAGTPIPAFIVRKEPKKHGTALWIEGDKNLRPGANVAIVEDVVTTGGSILKTIEIVHSQGLRVVKVLSLVDREEGGRENLARAGYSLESIFTKRDII
jgi:orotate phosphoribosyltransferase